VVGKFTQGLVKGKKGARLGRFELPTFAFEVHVLPVPIGIWYFVQFAMAPPTLGEILTKN